MTLEKAELTLTLMDKRVLRPQGLFKLSEEQRKEIKQSLIEKLSSLINKEEISLYINPDDIMVFKEDFETGQRIMAMGSVTAACLKDGLSYSTTTWCSSMDVFNPTIGSIIAVGRLLKYIGG